MKTLDYDPKTVMLCDHHWLKKKKQDIIAKVKGQQPASALINTWCARYEQSQSRLQARQNHHFPITYAEDLPVAQKKEELKALIAKHQVVVVAGETGSGKTTQLPKICLELGLGRKGMIGHTQPRRIAAHAVSHRIAEELKQTFGETIGYQVRFKALFDEHTLVKVMTDGILLNEIERDKFLNQYDTLIIDEAHERSLNIDFILGFLKNLIKKRKDLKVIITSATIDVERFSQHFNNAPIIEISGRTYDVQVNYLPADTVPQRYQKDMYSHIVYAVDEIEKLEREEGRGYLGDILVFLPGEADIRDTEKALNDAKINHAEILPLFSRLSAPLQKRIFQHNRHKGRRIILATNVAETSITVPGIRYVIDSGLHRISRYSYKQKVQRLPIEKISQASANQRSGRCGRVANGVCFRLYSEEDFNAREAFSPPEILRTNLSSVILQSLHLQLGPLEDFPFIEPPDRRFIRDGFKLLYELGAIDENHRLTRVGKKMSSLPLDPRLARMLIAANQNNCLHDVLIITSFLTLQDPREFPYDKKQPAQLAHARFNHKQSDFLSIINLWQYFQNGKKSLSNNQLKKQCHKEFINYIRMREWEDIYHQLKLLCKNSKMMVHLKHQDETSIHKALLAGLLGHMGLRLEGKDYLGANNKHFALFPGSALYKKPPAFLMAANLVETSKLFARTVASIEPEWALTHASHLVKYHYSEPYYSQKRGEVMAKERISLYGLTLSDNKPARFGDVDGETSYEIFLREALVHLAYEKSIKQTPAFWSHNMDCINEVLKLEDKARRRDLFINDELIYDFYKERIPNHINSVKAFDKWRLEVEKDKPNYLFFAKDFLIRDEASPVDVAQFPDHIDYDGLSFKVQYRFDLESSEDGVNITIPLTSLHLAPSNLFDWLVPGLLKEKCTALLKSLPKPIRKQFVPIPDTVNHILKDAKPGNHSLCDYLAKSLLSYKGVIVKPSDFDLSTLEKLYLAHFLITDENNQVLAKGRELQALKNQLKQQLNQHVDEQVKNFANTSDDATIYEHWTFGALKEKQLSTASGQAYLAYPAIVAHQNGVCIRYLSDKEDALKQSQQGLIILLCNTLNQELKYIKKNVFKSNQAKLSLSTFWDKEVFIEKLISALVDETFLQGPLPQNQDEFRALIQEHKSQLVDTANRYETIFLQSLDIRTRVKSQMQSFTHALYKDSLNDIDKQLNQLFAKQCMTYPLAYLSHYPRYLKGILSRLDKLQGQVDKDKSLMQQLRPHENKLIKVLDDDIDKLTEMRHFIPYRFMLEEFRISLFAQNLKTAMTVSAKRLEKLWQKSIAP